MNKLTRLLRMMLVALLFSSVSVFADPDIQLNAILGKQIIATVDGQQIKLKEGENNPDGLTLRSVENNTAVFEWQGKTFKLQATSRISAQFVEKPADVFSVSRDADGSYIAIGQIDGHDARFVVDTGADMVALNADQANRLGLQWKNAKAATASTAGGLTRMYTLTLNKVSIGAITVYDVEAAVIPNQTTPILLGMSFLRHFEMNESNNVLTLTKKF